jgi:hypothetical protein
MPMATPLSLTLLADDVIRWADICHPDSVNHRHHVHVAFTFGLARDAFLPENVSKVIEGSV